MTKVEVGLVLCGMESKRQARFITCYLSCSLDDGYVVSLGDHDCGPAAACSRGSRRRPSALPTKKGKMIVAASAQAPGFSLGDAKHASELQTALQSVLAHSLPPDPLAASAWSH